MTKREQGQALVEFALTMPLFILVVFVTIELALVTVSFYSETRMARETARWLAVRSSATNDDELADHVRDTMLPGLVNGDFRTSSFTPVRGTSSTPSTYKVGNMTVEFTPCLPNGSAEGSAASGSGTGVCTHPNRVAGSTLYVQMSYDVAPILFLPTTFRMGSHTVSLPTALPPYKVSVMVE